MLSNPHEEEASIIALPTLFTEDAAVPAARARREDVFFLPLLAVSEAEVDLSGEGAEALLEEGRSRSRPETTKDHPQAAGDHRRRPYLELLGGRSGSPAPAVWLRILDNARSPRPSRAAPPPISTTIS